MKSGNANLPPTKTLSVGTHTITAAHSGSTNQLPSLADAFIIAVNPASTTVNLISSHMTAVTGQSITYTATIRQRTPGSGVPTGTVTITDGTNILATGVSLDATGKMRATFNVLAVGSSIYSGLFSVGIHPIVVTFDGDTNFKPSVSSVLNQTINHAVTTIHSRLTAPTIFEAVWPDFMHTWTCQIRLVNKDKSRAQTRLATS